MDRIYAACDSFPIKGIYGEGNCLRLRAMTLLLRYSGIRLGDGVTLKRDRLRENKLFLYTQKTGTPVHVVLPPKEVLMSVLPQTGTVEAKFSCNVLLYIALG